MNSSKQLLKEAERLSKIGATGGINSTDPKDIPDFFRQDAFIQKWNSIPNKLAFKIGEVAELVGVKQYVLRYWETEFEELRPSKGQNNQRMYTRKNIELALMIQHLLHVERFSIEGVRKFMRKRKEDLRFNKMLKGSKKAIDDCRVIGQEIQSEIHQMKLRLDAYFRREV